MRQLPSRRARRSPSRRSRGRTSSSGTGRRAPARLGGLEERRAVERDRAAGVGADLASRREPVRRVAREVAAAVELVRGRRTTTSERRDLLLAVRRLPGTRGRSRPARCRGLVRPAVLVDEPAAAAPGRAVEAGHVEERPERDRGREQREAERPAGAEQAELEEPPAREPRAALLDELARSPAARPGARAAGYSSAISSVGDRLPVTISAAARQQEREPERRARGAASGAGAGRARRRGRSRARERAEAEQREHGELAARVRRAGGTIRSRSRLGRGAGATARASRTSAETSQPAHAAHALASSRSRRRRRRAPRAAMNHVTRPSGTGPRWPSAQPPRSSGFFAYCDVGDDRVELAVADRASARTSASRTGRCAPPRRSASASRPPSGGGTRAGDVAALARRPGGSRRSAR